MGPSSFSPKMPSKKSAKPKVTKKTHEAKPKNTVVSRLHTIHLHKRLFRVSFKNKAPRAIKEVVKFAQQQMRTKDVRIDPKLNQFLWSKGVRNVPYRVRVVLARKRNDDEE